MVTCTYRVTGCSGTAPPLRRMRLAMRHCIFGLMCCVLVGQGGLSTILNETAGFFFMYAEVNIHSDSYHIDYYIQKHFATQPFLSHVSGGGLL